MQARMKAGARNVLKKGMPKQFFMAKSCEKQKARAREARRLPTVLPEKARRLKRQRRCSRVSGAELALRRRLARATMRNGAEMSRDMYRRECRREVE